MIRVQARALAVRAPTSFTEVSVYMSAKEIAATNHDVIVAQILYEAWERADPLSVHTRDALTSLAMLQFARGDVSNVAGQNAIVRALYTLPDLVRSLTAEESFRRLLQKLTDAAPLGLALPNFDEGVLDARLSLARCLQAQGRFADAYLVFNDILIGTRAIVPPTQLSMLCHADASHNAASCLLDRDIQAGNPAATIVQTYNLFAAAYLYPPNQNPVPNPLRLSDKLVLLGDAHPSTLRSRLGLLHCRLIDPSATGPRPGAAANLHEAVLESRSALTAAVGALGYANRDVLIFFETRAQLLASSGDYVGAELPLRARLAVAQESFGVASDAALHALDDLAECLLKIGGAANVGEAEKLYGDCLYKRRQKKGGNLTLPPPLPTWLAWCPPPLLALWPLSLLVPTPPPGTLTVEEAETAIGAALAQNAKGECGEAAESLRGLLAEACCTPAIDPAVIVAIKANLGAVELARGKTADAIALLNGAFSLTDANLRMPPPMRPLFATRQLTESIHLDIQTTLALAHQKSSDFVTAIIYFGTVRAARMAALVAKPEPHREHAAVRDAVIDVTLKSARLYTERGAVGPPDDFSTAFGLFENAFDLQMNELGPAHPSTRDTALEIARFLSVPHVAARLPPFVVLKAAAFFKVACKDHTRPDAGNFVVALDTYMQLLKSGDFVAAEAGFGLLVRSFSVMFGVHDLMTILACHYQNKARLGIADGAKDDSAVAVRNAINAWLQLLARNEGFCDNHAGLPQHEWNANCHKHKGMLSALLEILPSAEFNDIVDVCRTSVAGNPADPMRNLNFGLVLLELSNEDANALTNLNDAINLALAGVAGAPARAAPAVVAAAMLLPDPDLIRLCAAALDARGRYYFHAGKMGAIPMPLPFNVAVDEYECAYNLRRSLLPPNIGDYVDPRGIPGRPPALPQSRFTPMFLNALTASDRADLAFLISTMQRRAFALEKSTPANQTLADLLLRIALNVNSDILLANFDTNNSSLDGALNDTQALYRHLRDKATGFETVARNTAAPLVAARNINGAAVIINAGAVDAAKLRASARDLYDEHLEIMLSAARRTLGDSHSSTIRVARELICFYKEEGRHQEAAAVRPR